MEMAACPMPHSGCVVGDSSCPQDFKVSSEKKNGNNKSVNTWSQHRSFLIDYDAEPNTQSSGSYYEADITNTVAFLMPLFNAIPILLTRTEASAEQLLIKS